MEMTKIDFGQQPFKTSMVEYPNSFKSHFAELDIPWNSLKHSFQ